ncbi:hypothetical protein SAMN04487911_11031 [Arenibacter nanhaiticus]|uniref:Sporulation related domain-containing protein n=1 Tax=Arenibacter nanhaiticus TaxID=558155 RepID=A0A1M6G541_9FLAO|nr:sporulation protein [Arenibacter nanhaiticus]SHJ05010.1 hypothetical protein SAMN04487911_11031 [Arenibacter nanhaiticus]
MPFIEESDLLELHKDIDKAQIINDRLLDQIKHKNKELKRSKIQRNVLGIVTGLFLIGGMVALSYNAGFVKSSNQQYRNSLEVIGLIDSLDIIKRRIENIKKQNEELSLLHEFYLAKRFLNKEKIYSVQVKTFVDNNITLSSESLGNTLFAKANPFYSYSLGNFETLEEARSFRYQLINMGFKDAFVASYRDGKRIEIEEPY